ncbi:MAG TPA: tetratricopeptide repeat protein [Oculatellaceae cyanobacterium]|jgi:tetratricopeptide (TPR) repeat protein
MGAMKTEGGSDVLMNYRQWLAIGLLVSLSGMVALDGGLAWGARKYYPPGYTPPAETRNQPESPAASGAQPPIKQVIIKTVQKDPLEVLLDERRFFEALRLVNERLKKTPGRLSLLFTRGRILRDSGSFNQAAAQFQSIFEHSRNVATKAQAMTGLGWTFYRKALQEEQSGNAEGMRQSIQAAQKAFQQATRLSPRLSEPWAGLGRNALLDKRVTEAETFVKRALKLSPGHYQSQLAQAELLLAKRQPEEALQVLYGLKRTTTHEPDVFLLLARASLDTNRVDDAIIHLKQLLELTPEHTAALRLLSHSYERKMMPDNAEQALQRAIALNPSDEKSVDALLKLYQQRGEHERGILLLTSLLKDKAEQPGYTRRLLEGLENLERWQQAYEESKARVPALLTHPKVSVADKDVLAHLFAVAVHRQARTLLDPMSILDTPEVKKLQDFLTTRLKEEVDSGRLGLETRLDTLLITPLTHFDVPPLSLEQAQQNVSTSLPIAFLSGNRKLYEQLLSLVEQDPASRLAVAKQLYQVGDYPGTLHVLKASGGMPPELQAEAHELERQLDELNAQRKLHVDAVAMLPKKIPLPYFKKAVIETLQLGMGDWKTHATLATAFEKRKEFRLAYEQQRLAAHFAPTDKVQLEWQKKAEKTLRRLSSTSH